MQSPQPCSDRLALVGYGRAGFQRRLLFAGALIEGTDKTSLVVGDNDRLGPCARQRDIEHLLVDEIGRAAVGVDHNAVGGLALGSIGGLNPCMAEVGVAQIGEVEPLFPAVGQPDCRPSLVRVDAGDAGEQSIGPPQAAIVARELDAIALPQFRGAGSKALDMNSAPLPGMPVDVAPIGRDKANAVALRIDGGNAQTVALAGRPPRYNLSTWTVTDDWPDPVPVTLDEAALFERWFGDLFDELFKDCP